MPYVPTADPVSATYGFYRHFGDHVMILNDGAASSVHDDGHEEEEDEDEDDEEDDE